MARFFRRHKLLQEYKDEAARWKWLAEHDELTGLYNRRAFYHRAPKYLFPKSLVFVLDIDDFKQVNDTHGHDYGDQYLCEVAATLERVANAYSSLACRLGGDEFAGIFLPNATDAIQFLEEQLFGVASIGIFLHGTGSSLRESLGKADTVLYNIKGNRQRCQHQ